MPIGPVILVDFLYFCIFDPLKHVFSEKKPGGTKWKKWQHGFLCSQYYLGYFKCILQDYSKKYYNISFPYINRWTNRGVVGLGTGFGLSGIRKLEWSSTDKNLNNPMLVLFCVLRQDPIQGSTPMPQWPNRFFDGSWFQSLMDANIVHVQIGDAV